MLQMLESYTVAEVKTNKGTIRISKFGLGYRLDFYVGGTYKHTIEEGLLTKSDAIEAAMEWANGQRH